MKLAQPTVSAHSSAGQAAPLASATRAGHEAEVWLVQFSPLLAANPAGLVRSASADAAGTSSGASGDPRAQEQGRVVVAAHIIAMKVADLALPASQDPSTSATSDSQPQVRRVEHQPITIHMQSVNELEGSATLTLRHPELGSMTIDVDLHGGQVDVRVAVSNARAADVLRDSEQLLRGNVALQGVALRALDVSVTRRVARKPKPTNHQARNQRARDESNDTAPHTTDEEH